VKDIKVIHEKTYGLRKGTSTVAGTQKLCQRYVMELLTEKGSMRFLPHRGCLFLTRLHTQAKTEFDVLAAFAASKSRIRRNLVSDEHKDTPPEERFADAKLLEIIVLNGYVTLEIAVKSVAGNTGNITTPPIPMR
jgi:hypothetical protein